MSYSPIARRYAKALIELCNESKNHTVIGKQLETFAETWKSSPELQAILQGSVAPVADRKDILGKIFARHLFAPTTRNFLFVLLEAGRLAEIGEMVSAFNAMLDEQSLRVRASVTSAVPLEKNDIQRIQAALQRLTGKAVMLEARVDPTIIGGVVTTVGNHVLDGSLKSQLARIGERFAEN
ncbi:MAG: ATP synthase F1 subunit delta [Deltaproteobacteria bacterium]|nr:ATP synthase F1 subunit delta [Deltaproteobacteria bacterium]